MKYIEKILRGLGIAVFIIFILIAALLVYFNWPVKEGTGPIELGVTFSSRYASDIGLNWREAYIAALDGLNLKKIRLPVYWDLSEPEKGRYDFSDVDWQLAEAKKRNVEVILTLGQKVPRWPECAIPKWLADDDSKRKEALLNYLSVAVDHFKSDSPEIKFWQVENEPFLPFGICPALDVDLLDREIALVHKKDGTRPVVISDSGELSLWVRAAKRADVFGTTMYRTIWKKGIGYFDYPIGPRFFRFKYYLNKYIAHQDKAFVVELQAEPWISSYTTNEPLEEQFKSMNADKLKDNVAFAKKVGFPQVYLWGVEWWYWLKTEKNQPELWETARELFKNQ